jgi:hypothetical protein
MTANSLTQERLKELLHYEPETGTFTWVKARPGCKLGATAGTINCYGYVQIMLDRVTYRAHRLALLYVHGLYPPDGVDHINRGKTDNRIVNLRYATSAENSQNNAKGVKNTTGYVGVIKYMGKYRAQVYKNKVQYNLGVYETTELAYAAYLEGKAALHTFNPVPRNMAC